MATSIPHPVVYTFKEFNQGKYKTVRHFELFHAYSEKKIFSEKLNLSENQNYALSTPKYWLKIRQGNKWSKDITGLFKTKYTNFYRGDLNKRQHLIIFRFLEDQETLRIYFYPNYFSRNIDNLITQIINQDK